MKSLAIVAVLALVGLTFAQLSASNAMGDWVGDSKCVNLVASPGCKDERIALHITRVLDKNNKPVPDQVLVREDQIVDKKSLTKGYLTFKIDFAQFRIHNEFKKKGKGGIWSLFIKDNTMSGTLTKMPEGVVIRKITLKRTK